MPVVDGEVPGVLEVQPEDPPDRPAESVQENLQCGCVGIVTDILFGGAETADGLDLFCREGRAVLPDELRDDPLFGEWPADIVAIEILGKAGIEPVSESHKFLGRAGADVEDRAVDRVHSRYLIATVNNSREHRFPITLPTGDSGVSTGRSSDS
jgi:hypothetical protein